MNYYQIRNKRLNAAYRYSKIKKELKDGRNKGNDTEERSRKEAEKEKATTQF